MSVYISGFYFRLYNTTFKILLILNYKYYKDAGKETKQFLRQQKHCNEKVLMKHRFFQKITRLNDKNRINKYRKNKAAYR